MLYLCICVFLYFRLCVFDYETLVNSSFDILGPRAFRQYMVCMANTSYSGDVTDAGRQQRTREVRATQHLIREALSLAIPQ